MGRRRFSRPTPLAEMLKDAPVLPSTAPLFETIPAKLAEGRVEGFESLRDTLLANWRSLATEFEIPLPQLLKLVLETDRHALFAALSEEKLGDASQAKIRAHKQFQDYLHGEVDMSLLPEVKLSEAPVELPEEEG